MLTYLKNNELQTILTLNACLLILFFFFYLHKPSCSLDHIDLRYMKLWRDGIEDLSLIPFSFISIATLILALSLKFLSFDGSSSSFSSSYFLSYFICPPKSNRFTVLEDMIIYPKGPTEEECSKHLISGVLCRQTLHRMTLEIEYGMHSE